MDVFRTGRFDSFCHSPKLKAMAEKPRKLKIARRLLNGWSGRVENRDPEKCDLDGAKLWINPGGQLYCDLVHDQKESSSSVLLPR